MRLFLHIGNKLNDVQCPPFFWFNDNNRMYVNIKSIMDNKYMSDIKRESLIYIYCRIKRVINGFERLVRIWRWRKARSAAITVDLYMNPLDKFRDVEKICILHNDTIYDFRITDLLVIWDNSLCHSNSFTPAPLFPKNPYTNIPFNIANLVACYIKASKLNLDIPQSIVLFWNSFMDIDKFTIDAYPLLKERAVVNYIFNSDNETLFYDSINMISSMRRYIGTKCIDEDMSISKRDIFVSKLKPLLISHLTSLHSCNKLKKYHNKSDTIDGLRRVFKNSPGFGRRIVRGNRELNRLVPSNIRPFVFRGGL
jgi:hypothetical protein